jgi:hypothetical protein
MSKRARWILFGVVLLAVICFGSAKVLHEHEPVARWPLPDGTELRLEYVTYGTHHVIPGAGKIIAWLAAVAHHRFSPRVPYYNAEYTCDTATPRPVLWFTCSDLRTGEFSIGHIASAELVSEPGIYRYATLNGRLEKPLPTFNFQVPSYNRREPTFRVRIKTTAKTFDIDVPNPVFGTIFPEWVPKPLPQTQRVGKYEITLRSLDLIRSRYGWIQTNPVFELLESGLPAEGIQIQAAFSDATGNSEGQGSQLDFPLLTEPAWKVSATLSRADNLKVELGTAEFIVAPPKLPESAR